MNVLLLLTLLPWAINGDGDSDSVAAAFRRYRIFPDIISDVPQRLLSVKYADDVNVLLGNAIPPEQVGTCDQLVTRGMRWCFRKS